MVNGHESDSGKCTQLAGQGASKLIMVQPNGAEASESSQLAGYGSR
eukprot:CAMPEP_0114248852 /NCGR_PEP_ID=MMETSP0058-20121206/13804_1 /TAXON_ID=36894 /ORGANISM="Pyramimonas parkeae, CCMP726" /LENGTH=45 /DNA_ID= /DNA_START= /DNA_END= /DNA_ORIENTATION=